MRAVHDYARIARAAKAVFIQSKCRLVKIGVAIDLHLEAKVRSFVTHVATLVVHNNTKAGVILTDEGKSTRFLLAWHLNARQVVASANTIHDVCVINHQVGATARSLTTDVKLNGIDASIILEVELIHLRKSSVLPIAKKWMSYTALFEANVV